MTTSWPRDTIRDRFWLWGHEAGSHDCEWNLPTTSRMTPVEAACYLGIPNLLMIRYNGKPAMPYDQLTIPMRVLRRVGSGITGARGKSSARSATMFSLWRNALRT